MAVQIQIRRGTALEWTNTNPILAEGEMGTETDTNKFKFGNGVDAWQDLPYANSGSSSSNYSDSDVDLHLNVGTATTGQVLSWDGTDYDWVAQSSGGGSGDYTVTEADVTTHQAALSITESQISDLQSYLTDYTVTEADVTTHQAALSITESQISDLGNYLTAETLTSLSFSNNVLTYTDENSGTTNIDFTALFDLASLLNAYSGGGLSGQVLISNGSGGFSWGYSTDNVVPAITGPDVYETFSEFPTTAVVNRLSYDISTDRTYIWDGIQWVLYYDTGEGNNPPVITQGGDGAYTIAYDTPLELTFSGYDPEDQPVTWSYEITNGSLDTEIITRQELSAGSTKFLIDPNTIAGQNSFDIDFIISDGEKTAKERNRIYVNIMRDWILNLERSSNVSPSSLDFEPQYAYGYQHAAATNQVITDIEYSIQSWDFCPDGNSAFSCGIYTGTPRVIYHANGAPFGSFDTYTLPQNASDANRIFDRTSYTRDTSQDGIDTPVSVKVSPNFDKLYVLGSDAGSCKIVQYSITQPGYSNQNPQITYEKTLSLPGTRRGGFDISFDGRYMYVSVDYNSTNFAIERYELTTPWDISTAEIPTSGSSMTTSSLALGVQINLRDGDNLYISLEDEYQIIRRYALSTAWSLISTSLTQSIEIGDPLGPANNRLYYPNSFGETDRDSATQYISLAASRPILDFKIKAITGAQPDDFVTMIIDTYQYVWQLEFQNAY